MIQLSTIFDAIYRFPGGKQIVGRGYNGDLAFGLWSGSEKGAGKGMTGTKCPEQVQNWGELNTAIGRLEDKENGRVGTG